ncbi:methyltransferase N6AMT1 [Stomoxys calcitrans]|uniref:methyltransferase N6AMT1 n=1 Tax=Stomoxys calcitrans TaxID=35570 RepID=UPI0027E36CA9|nr:methyltransferase N6AMT1 [Stomoxys calcitrans]
METPHIDHLSTQDYESVYEPAEDSFLLLDALESDLEFIEGELKPLVCLEIGPGSGIIITALSKRLQNSFCFACDINRTACQVTKRTAARNNVQVECIVGNLVDAFKSNKVDLLIFNPPYVVTSDDEVLSSETFGDCTRGNLVHSWAGGKDGRRIIDILLLKLNEVLSPKGFFYLLLLRENKPDEIIEKLLELGFEGKKFMERRIPGEYLYILKIERLRS